MPVGAGDSCEGRCGGSPTELAGSIPGEAINRVDRRDTSRKSDGGRTTGGRLVLQMLHEKLDWSSRLKPDRHGEASLPYGRLKQ